MAARVTALRDTTSSMAARIVGVSIGTSREMPSHDSKSIDAGDQSTAAGRGFSSGTGIVFRTSG